MLILDDSRLRTGENAGEQRASGWGQSDERAQERTAGSDGRKERPRQSNGRRRATSASTNRAVRFRLRLAGSVLRDLADPDMDSQADATAFAAERDQVFTALDSIGQLERERERIRVRLRPANGLDSDQSKKQPSGSLQTLKPAASPSVSGPASTQQLHGAYIFSGLPYQ